jgi:hypothetical protein
MKRLILVTILIAGAVMAGMPRNADAAGYPYPQRITFAPGAISATVYGALPMNGIDQWVLRIFGGQMLTVNLAPKYGIARFSVVGANGAQLISGTTFWSGVVPQTQDYYITIDAYNNTAPQYAMTVTAPPTPAPVPAPQRRDVNGTWDSPNYIVELNQAIGCMNAECPITGRLIHITDGAPEIVNIDGTANSNSGTVSFNTELAGGQRFNGTVSANSRTLSGTLSGAGWITFTRR